MNILKILTYPSGQKSDGNKNVCWSKTDRQTDRQTKQQLYELI